ncbi:hypothetical protein BDZ89DRAFT_1130809 [Hymenopellis radicata]|nr:hypothetical protein BDZ89DRAFT_1130809 [Hymenopellis radicata]
MPGPCLDPTLKHLCTLTVLRDAQPRGLTPPFPALECVLQLGGNQKGASLLVYQTSGLDNMKVKRALVGLQGMARDRWNSWKDLHYAAAAASNANIKPPRYQ